jgi:SAM-dependent methyltransferase
VLGLGDLHPGGALASAQLLEWLSEHEVRRVLEVGGGIGNTTARMMSAGWDVTVIEPDPILFEELRLRCGAAARRESFLEHRAIEPYDAIVAESVLFQLDLAQAFAHARALLRPGGYLSFVEAVWIDSITAAQSEALHERTHRLFGIPVGSREPLTWRDWARQLGECGFVTVRAQLLPPGAAGAAPTANRLASLLSLARRPRLAASVARYRLRMRLARMPGLQESWIFLGRATDTGASLEERPESPAGTSRSSCA